MAAGRVSVAIGHHHRESCRAATRTSLSSRTRRSAARIRTERCRQPRRRTPAAQPACPPGHPGRPVRGHSRSQQLPPGSPRQGLGPERPRPPGARRFPQLLQRLCSGAAVVEPFQPVSHASDCAVQRSSPHTGLPSNSPRDHRVPEQDGHATLALGCEASQALARSCTPLGVMATVKSTSSAADRRARVDSEGS